MRDIVSPFKIGDGVTVHTSRGGPQSIAEVKAFAHEGRRMILSDDSEWRADGKRQWSAHGNFYNGPWVTPTEDGDAAHIAKRRAIGRVRKFADTLDMETPLSSDAMGRIVDLIEAELKAVGEG